jgi:tyrosine-protein phosphatase YwqE
MFSIFKKKYEGATDLSGIKTDMHSHILPGIDDGAQDEEQSVQLIKGLQELGYAKFIATPHILSDMYPNNRETITGALSNLGAVLKENDHTVDLSAAAEYYLDDHFTGLLESNTPLLTLTEKYVLVEFPFVSAPYNYKEQLFQLQLSGYQPVLAHPERYSYFYYQKEVFDDLKSAGCLFQSNLLSLIGYYGKQAQDLALYLKKKGYINLLGTDLHHLRHLEALRTSKQIQPIVNSFLDSGQLMNPDW